MSEHIRKSKKKICIVGAGVSGLIAAKVLEENGYFPTLIESSNDVGGRLKTIIKGRLSIRHRISSTPYRISKS